jgi:dipeptidyl aminopeptidase/acylaminoacyl peptidase
MQGTSHPIKSRRILAGLFPRIAVFIFCFVTCPSFGQGKQKKHLTAGDYHLWSKLLTDKISPKGKWVSYRLMYESRQDTLFVRNTASNSSYAFPKGRDGFFNGEEWFGCIGANDSLWVRNLKLGTLRQYPGVLDFSFSGNGKYLLLLEKADAEKRITVLDMSGNILETIPNVGNWHLEPERNGVAYSTAAGGNYGVGIMLLGSTITEKPVIDGGKNAFVNLHWKGSAVTFVGTGPSPVVYCYTMLTKQLKSYDPAVQSSFPAGVKISDNPFGTMIISDDGTKVFFDLKEKNASGVSEADTVQVWRTDDKLLYSHRKNIGEYANFDKLAMWNVSTGALLQVSDRELPVAMLSGDYNHAIVYDPIAYEPQNHFDGAVDVYIVDLATGKRKLVLQEYTGDRASLRLSQQGKYLAYPKNGHWWVFDVKTETHTNITEGLGIDFLQNTKEVQEEPSAYKNPDWTRDETAILLYDEFDVWAVSPDRKWYERLTRGRETGDSFRGAHLLEKPSYPRNITEAPMNNFSLEGGLLMQAANKQTGDFSIYRWTKKDGLKLLVRTSNKISQLGKAAKNETILFVAENFDMASKIMTLPQDKRKPVTIFESNKQQQRYFWGRSELIHYNALGKNLSGALYYPADYQAGVRYPMVVEIYERPSQFVNHYVNPSEFNEGGFNIANFTTKGYFVLQPDISYLAGEVGASATECVLAAVDTVIDKGLVDPQRLGLIGHSFGGYETNLIVTRTDRFSAAAAGDGWADLVSAYLYVGATMQRPDFYRGEFDQWRIGKSLFEDTEGYLRNSPVLHAAKVTTPLLSWTGAEDWHVNYLQSFEFHLALRRLQKKAIMLVYPEEGHSLLQRTHQKDLTRRIEAWFGFYLKNDSDCAWMAAN